MAVLLALELSCAHQAPSTSLHGGSRSSSRKRNHSPAALSITSRPGEMHAYAMEVEQDMGATNVGTRSGVGYNPMQEPKKVANAKGIFSSPSSTPSASPMAGSRARSPSSVSTHQDQVMTTALQFHPANRPANSNKWSPQHSPNVARSPSHQAGDGSRRTQSPAQQYSYEQARRGLMGLNNAEGTSSSAGTDKHNTSRPPFNAISKHSNAGSSDGASGGGSSGQGRRGSRRAASPAPSVNGSMSAFYGSQRSNLGNSASRYMRSSSGQSPSSASGSAIPFAKGQRGASPRVFGGSTMQPTPSTGVVSISPKTRNKQKVSNVTSRTDYAPPQDASATERILSPPYDENGVDMDQAQRTPYREAFSSTGRRYFYNVVTRTSTYREPAMYIPYEG